MFNHANKAPNSEKRTKSFGIDNNYDGVEVLYKKANRIFAYANMDALDETKKLQKIKESYDKWASSKNLSVKNYFSILKKRT